MAKKDNKKSTEGYNQINKLCQIMIDNLIAKISQDTLDENLKWWKNGDSILEIITKLVAILTKLESSSLNVEKPKDQKNISKNDYLALVEFIKEYESKSIINANNIDN